MKSKLVILVVAVVAILFVFTAVVLSACAIVPVA